MTRRLIVGALTAIITAPLAFIGFAMGLMVAEQIIHPTVALLTAVITGLLASWLADGLAADGQRTDINQVVRRNLVWGLVPALAALAYFWLTPLFPSVFLLGAIVIWTATTATRFAFRYRVPKPAVGNRLAHLAAWIGGAALATAAIVFVASLLGLTGA